MLNITMSDMPSPKVILSILGASSLSSTAAVTALADFSNSVGPDFAFGAFDGNLTPDAAGLNVTVAPGANTFGGLGQNLSLLGNPAVADGDELIIVGTLNPGTTTSDLVFAIREQGAGTTPGEFFSFTVPASNFPEGVLTTFRLPLTTASGPFIGDTTDGTINGNVGEVSFQSPFGGTGGLNFTLQSVSLDDGSAPVPEPSSALLVALSASGLLRRRR